MKKFLFSILIGMPFLAYSQLGVKAGPNFANITHAKEIKAGTRTGYHAGIFYGSSKGLLSSRTELLYSHQGYDFSTMTNTGVVNLDYLLLPQFLAINITPLFQIQLGGQIAYLINAEVDSTSSTGNNSADKIINLMNRIDYGLGGGVEVHTIKMLVIGARVNIGMGKIFKVPEDGKEYSFIPDIDTKSNLFQLYAGIRFGAD
ncbi:MAG: outer membrane beta-barrel protein [Saprospiraceae bacterium]